MCQYDKIVLELDANGNQTALDAVGLFPIIGVIKFGDEVAVIIKQGDNMLEVKGMGKTGITPNDVQFSDKFSKPAYKNQVGKRGWTNETIAETINNPVKTGTTTNKYTGNEVTIYYCDDVHYVAVDNGTGKVIQVADLSEPDWKLDLNK